jgi:hypothetical protein
MREHPTAIDASCQSLVNAVRVNVKYYFTSPISRLTRHEASIDGFFLQLELEFRERYVKCRCYGLGGTGIPKAAHRAI